MNYFYKENPRLQAAVDQYFALLSEYNDLHFAGSLSIILLGSLSRGEATWIETETGPVMVSDIEFFTVYPKGFDRFSEFDKAIEAAAQMSFPGSRSTLFHVDNSYVCKQHMPFIERKLLTYDAMVMGKTVVGEDVVSLLPKITLDNINLQDIRDILTHRMFSVLYYGIPLKEKGEQEQYRYCLAKNSLDLMTVLLVIHGQLASGFANRLELVRLLPVDGAVKDFFGYCLSIKLGTICDGGYTIDEMENMFAFLVSDLCKQLRVPVINIFRNGKHVLRRILGICKRGLRYKHIPDFGHLQNLIGLFERKKQLTRDIMMDNLVINGYPNPVKEI